MTNDPQTPPGNNQQARVTISIKRAAFRLLPAAILLFVGMFVLKQFQPLSQAALHALEINPPSNVFLRVLLFDTLAPAVVALIAVIALAILGMLLGFRAIDVVAYRVETQILVRFPGIGKIYELVREGIQRCIDALSGSGFGKPVMLFRDSELTYYYGFLMGRSGQIARIFCPFGPVPTHGPLFHVHQSCILQSSGTVLEVTQYIVGIGTTLTPNIERDTAAAVERWVSMGLIPSAQLEGRNAAE